MATTTQQSLRQTLQHRIDNKTKPLGALGRLEEIALRVGLLQGTSHPVLSHPHIVVFAGDHGIAATGLVNPYPQAVTAQMVLNFIRGGAAINVFSRQHGLGLVVVDAGVNFEFDPALVGDRLVSKKIGFGTRDYLEGPAMTAAETAAAIGAGSEVVARLAEKGCNCIGFGEMGIGNTSSASLIMSYIMGMPVAECVGRGTGASDEQLAQKRTTLEAVHARHQPVIAADPTAPVILQCVGGYEIAMLTGAYLEAARRKMVILADGFISTSALLLARLIDPGILDNCIFSHCSGERGHTKMLEWLGARPLLQLDMRLGEGTGAALAYPFVAAAVNFLEEMASFESAGVSKSGEI
ncbi:MAG TPA: nicotinate-nucleotide--dimethylbenzimidazole phosphoribosyltransferase [Puia sp.]|jgi:nicotinate-nucleotide--dimethylbenzimidazole phosphoribosyltransferase|nr:nicotinate-nucleotide--dimethylbenzimidazole phosphoribosyltransferase [Puia sp.]